ncbi:MAG: alpha/beta hydrolase [Lactococcus sp.]
MNKRLKKKRIKTIPLLVLIIIMVGLSFLLGRQSVAAQKRSTQENTIASSSSSATKIVTATSASSSVTPTFYITGSGGTAHPLDRLIEGMFPTLSPQKDCLNLQVDISKNDKLTVSGSINPLDKTPIIEFATVKGTISGEIYAKAIKVAMDYLVSKYHYQAINLVGYSSGGTGAIYYMMDYANVANLPKVKKYLSLDGEYNTEAHFQVGETLTSLLTNGPILKTPMYDYIAAHYSQISPETQIYLLEGNWNTTEQTDGAIPWADTFSIYHLLMANKNPVSIYLYPTQYKHGRVVLEPLVQNYIKKIIY